MSSDQARNRAEALFARRQTQLREGQLAMAEYQAEQRAVRAKTERLRALRQARDAANRTPSPRNRGAA